MRVLTFLFLVSLVHAQIDLDELLPNLSEDSPVVQRYRDLLEENGFSEVDTCPQTNATNAVTNVRCSCTVNQTLWTPVWIDTTVGRVAPRFEMNMTRVLEACGRGELCAVCPIGHECLGVATEATNARGLCQKCSAGQYCPAHVANPSVLAVANICPAGSYCPNATVELTCPEGFYCPEGTVDPVSCVLQDEDKGLYCDEGSFHPYGSCPAGYYCPTPQQKLTCPSGHYCPQGTFEPRDCQPLASCGQGEQEPPISALGVIIAILSLLFVIVVGWILHLRYRRFQKHTKKENLERDRVRKLRSQLYEMVTGHSLSRYKFSGFKKKAVPVSIGFRDISLVIRDNGRKILHGTSGEFKSGHLYAIMGPSGSGKTSFLNSLTGKASGYGVVSGDILINNSVVTPADYKPVTGFVPQTDTVHSALTVRENLAYSARLRLPPDTDTETITSIVRDVISVLHLTPIQDSLVGSVEMKQRISGGQKKRVNVGLEMVANPTVLFLDEPTTGLDSTGAFEVISALRTMTDLGWTIITVIHQPRYSIFTLFDQVMFLGMGGYTVYLGPATKAVEYFESLGFRLPESENPADTMMDIIAGKVPLKDEGFDTSLLPKWWKEKQQHFSGKSAEGVQRFAPIDRFEVMHDLEARFEAIDVTKTGVFNVEDFENLFASAFGVDFSSDLKELVHHLFEQMDKDLDGEISKEDFVAAFVNDSSLNVIKAETLNHPTTSQKRLEVMEKFADKIRNGFGADKHFSGLFKRWLPKKNNKQVKRRNNETTLELMKIQGEKAGAVSQFFEFLERSILKHWRDRYVKLFEIVVLTLATLIIGSMQGSAWRFNRIDDNTMLGHLGFSLLNAAASLRLMGHKHEKAMYWREAASGLNRLSYFLAKNVSDLFDIFYRAFLFAAVYYGMTAPELAFGDFVGITLMLSWATSGIAYMLSTLFDWNNAQVATLVFVLVLAAFVNGVNPSLGSYEGGVMYYVTAISPSRWSVEAVLVKVAQDEAVYYPSAVSAYLDLQGYELDNFDVDMLALFLLGVMYRILSFVFLIGTNRAKQI